jgi:hypothetical protein
VIAPRSCVTAETWGDRDSRIPLTASNSCPAFPAGLFFPPLGLPGGPNQIILWNDPGPFSACLLLSFCVARFYSCGRLEACKRRPPGQVTQRHLLYAASKALAAFLAARSAVTIARRVARCLSGWAGREFGACSIGLFVISRDEAGWSQTV